MFIKNYFEKIKSFDFKNKIKFYLYELLYNSSLIISAFFAILFAHYHKAIFLIFVFIFILLSIFFDVKQYNLYNKNIKGD